MAISAPSAHNVVQSVRFYLPRTDVTVPAYNNAQANYRQWGSSSFSITPKFANSHIRIVQHVIVSQVSSHFYLSWKRGGTSGQFLHNDTSGAGSSASDGLFANHNGTGSDYWSAVVVWEDTNPSYTLGNSITYVPYVAMWSSTTLYLGHYYNNGNGNMAQGFHGYLEEIAYT